MLYTDVIEKRASETRSRAFASCEVEINALLEATKDMVYIRRFVSGLVSGGEGLEHSRHVPTTWVRATPPTTQSVTSA